MCIPTPTFKANICVVMKLTSVNVAVPPRIRTEPPISVEMELMKPGTIAKKEQAMAFSVPASIRMSPPKIISGWLLKMLSRSAWIV